MTSNRKNLLSLIAFLVGFALIAFAANWIVFANRFQLSSFARALLATCIFLIVIVQGVFIARVRTTN